MSNGAECCAIGVCCPPASAQQRAALVKIAVRDTGCDPATAAKIVEALSVHVAFAPKTIEPFIQHVVSLTATHKSGS